MAEGFRRVDPIALRDLIEGSGVQYRQNIRSYIFTCTRCNKKDKLLMFKADGRFICWICAETSGFKGRPEFALAEILGRPIHELRSILYGDRFEATETSILQLNLLDFYGEEDLVPEELVEQVMGIKMPWDFYPIDEPQARKGLDYCLSRGIDLDLAKKYDLRYCPVQRRVIFPIKIGPKVVGWQARAIFPTEWEDEDGTMRSAPKILTTGPRENVLMFQDNLVGSDHAVICEGPVDALKASLVGGAVATMGKVVSKQQMAIVRGSGVSRVLIALDPDAARETEKLVKEFADLKVHRLLPAPGYKDLGEMTPEQVLRQALQAPRVYPGQLFLHFRGAN